MPIAFVQSTTLLTTPSATPHVKAFTSNVTAGNSIIVCNTTRNFNLVTGITDSLGNTYTKATSLSANSYECGIWYASNVAGGACTVSVAYASTGTTGRIFLREYSGIAATSPLDVSLSSAQAASTTYSVGPTATTTTANQLVIAAFASGSSSATPPTAGTGYGNIQAFGSSGVGSQAVEDAVVSAIGTQTATVNWAVGVAGVASIATFKEVVAALPRTITGISSITGINSITM